MPSLADSPHHPEPSLSEESVIGPTRGSPGAALAELWRSRELLVFFVWRDLKVRYKQTALGVAWAVLQPTLLMLAFTFAMNRLQPERSAAVPYPLFVFAGLVPWMLFAGAVTGASQSVVAAERMITKIYFPRLALPLSAVGVALVDFCLAGAALAAMCVYYDIPLQSRLWLIGPSVALLLVAALGVGVWLAALNVSYRDVRYVAPFLIQLGLVATPAIYMPATPETQASNQSSPETSADGPETSRLWSATDLNPLNALVGWFRSAVLDTPPPPLRAGPIVGLALLLVSGCWYFQRVEDRFADII